MTLPTIFCLASGRSGTHFLYEILRRNTRGVICRHEPYGMNPSMFGRPIYDYAVGDQEAIERLAKKKQQAIERHRGAAAYVETSHAFLKSWADCAMGFFPGMKLVHLVRDPLAVAKSEATREQLAHRWRLPFRNYRGGNGQAYFRWSLTGLEPIFSHLASHSLSRLQWYVVQWIEIENRAMIFLKRHGKQRDCFTLHSPVELNDTDKVRSLLDFLAVPRRGADIVLAGRKNRTPGVSTVILEQDRRELAEVVRLLPEEYVAIFRQPPYCNWPWAIVF